MKVIYGGHWTNIPEGWQSYPEAEQDLTTPLKKHNDSVDIIYLEHVHEHLPFVGCIFFFNEAMRVLRGGGILRIVGPMLDQLMRFDDQTEIGKNYTKVQLSHYYPAELEALKQLGIDFMDYGKPFMFDSLMKGHNHKFIWTSRLMAHVLTKIGFDVNITIPGASMWDPDSCLERVIRGVDVELAWNLGFERYDPESLVVEARKPDAI